MLTKNTKIICTILAMFMVGMSEGSGYFRSMFNQATGRSVSFGLPKPSTAAVLKYNGDMNENNLEENSFGLFSSETTPGEVRLAVGKLQLRVLSYSISNPDSKYKYLTFNNNIISLPIFSSSRYALPVSFILEAVNGTTKTDGTKQKFLGLVWFKADAPNNSIATDPSGTQMVSLYAVEQSNINGINNNSQGEFGSQKRGGFGTGSGQYRIVTTTRAALTVEQIKIAAGYVDPVTQYPAYGRQDSAGMQTQYGYGPAPQQPQQQYGPYQPAMYQQQAPQQQYAQAQQPVVAVPVPQPQANVVPAAAPATPAPVTPEPAASEAPVIERPGFETQALVPPVA